MLKTRKLAVFQVIKYKLYIVSYALRLKNTLKILSIHNLKFQG